MLDFITALGSLARWCRGDGPRLVHIHSAVRGSLYRKSVCVALTALAGRPVVLQLHAGAGDIDTFAARLGPVRRALLGAAMRRADVVISVSRAGARRIEENFAVEGIIVVPNPAPAVNGVRPAAPPAEVNGSGPQALFLVASPTLRRAARCCCVRCPDPRRVPRPARDACRFRCSPDELTELQRSYPGIRWAGWLDQRAAREQLAQCDVFMMPSVSEGMPVALLEAMAYARAIVATPVGGIPTW